MKHLKFDCLNAVRQNPIQPVSHLVSCGWDAAFAAVCLSVLKTEELAITMPSGWHLTAKGVAELERQQEKIPMLLDISGAINRADSQLAALVIRHPELKTANHLAAQDALFTARQRVRALGNVAHAAGLAGRDLRAALVGPIEGVVSVEQLLQGLFFPADMCHAWPDKCKSCCAKTSLEPCGCSDGVRP